MSIDCWSDSNFNGRLRSRGLMIPLCQILVKLHVRPHAQLKGNLPHLESTLQMLSRMEWRKQSVLRKVHCVEKIKIQFDSYLQIFW